jgi:hypothetical protein
MQADLKVGVNQALLVVVSDVIELGKCGLLVLGEKNEFHFAEPRMVSNSITSPLFGDDRGLTLG